MNRDEQKADIEMRMAKSKETMAARQSIRSSKAESENLRLKDRVHELKFALTWCGLASDFQPGGKYESEYKTLWSTMMKPDAKEV